MKIVLFYAFVRSISMPTKKRTIKSLVTVYKYSKLFLAKPIVQYHSSNIQHQLDHLTSKLMTLFNVLTNVWKVLQKINHCICFAYELESLGSNGWPASFGWTFDAVVRQVHCCEKLIIGQKLGCEFVAARNSRIVDIESTRRGATLVSVSASACVGSILSGIWLVGSWSLP